MGSEVFFPWSGGGGEGSGSVGRRLDGDDSDREWHGRAKKTELLVNPHTKGHSCDDKEKVVNMSWRWLSKHHGRGVGLDQQNMKEVKWNNNNRICECVERAEVNSGVKW